MTRRPPGGGVIARRREALTDAHGTTHRPDPEDDRQRRARWRSSARALAFLGRLSGIPIHG
jgi:hypothetical protein